MEMAESVNSEDLPISLQQILNLVGIDSIKARKLIGTLDLKRAVDQIKQQIDEDTANGRRTPLNLLQGIIRAFMLRQIQVLHGVRVISMQKNRSTNPTENTLIESVDADELNLDDSLGYVETNRNQLMRPNVTPSEHEANIEILIPVPLNSVVEAASNLPEKPDNMRPEYDCAEIEYFRHDHIQDASVEPMSDHAEIANFQQDQIQDVSVGPISGNAIINMASLVGPREGTANYTALPRPRSSRTNTRRDRISVRWGNSLELLDPVGQYSIVLLLNVFTESVESEAIDTEALAEADVNQRLRILDNFQDIVEALLPIPGVVEEASAEASASLTTWSIEQFNQAMAVHQRKCYILSKKHDLEEGYIYSLQDMTPEPHTRLNFIITIIALLELRDNNMAIMKIDKQSYLAGITLKR